MIFKFRNKIFEATENPDGSLTFLNVNVFKMSLFNLLNLPWSNYSWSVKENFYCNCNHLTSLKGCPTSIGGNFNCGNNNLISLVGCPTSVDKDFNCYNNKLINLKDSPISVGGYFDCSNNQLTSLEGCPTSIKGKFCSDKFSHEDYLSYIMKNKINQL